MAKVARVRKSTEEIDVFRAALGAVRGRTARSSLYRWLRAHHDPFLEDWTEAADWPAFVQAFAALGLTDRTGKAPAPETARKTWLQVRKDVARARAKQPSGRAPALAPGEIAPGVRAAPSAQAGLDGGPAFLELDIRPARPAAVFQIAEAPASGPAPIQTNEDADAQIRRVLAAAAANKVPTPKPIENE